MQQLGHRMNTAIVMLGLAFLSAACSSSSSNSNGANNSTVDCSKGAIPKFSELTGLSKCTSCHSSTLTGAGRSDAPTTVNYDTYVTAKDLADMAVEELESNSMPPAGSPELTAAEIDAIERWASCGTPE